MSTEPHRLQHRVEGLQGGLNLLLTHLLQQMLKVTDTHTLTTADPLNQMCSRQEGAYRNQVPSLGGLVSDVWGCRDERVEGVHVR